MAEDVALVEKYMPRRMPGAHRQRLELQKHGDAVYLIAWLEEVPVGHLLLEWGGPGNSGAALAGSPELSDISVHPARQSQGIGSQLMEVAERLAGQRGYRRVTLSVAVDNARARALYERRGYRDSGLGTHCSRWPYLDEQGREHWREELCVRLVKRLAGRTT